MIHAALIGPSHKWLSLLLLEIKENWEDFCLEIYETINKQQSQTQIKKQ